MIHALQAVGLWALFAISGLTLFALALRGRRRQARRDRANHLIRLHAAGRITDDGVDRLRSAIRQHRAGSR